MTSSAQWTSKVAIAYFLLLLHGSRSQVGRTIWILLNLRDTLRALKDVYPNGRRVGVVTRRKRIRQALAGWICLVAVQPITLAADTILSWIPFYSSIKMLIVLALSFWRLESSAFLFQALVVPFVRRYEKDLDLILLLIGSTALLFFHFLFELPWNALCSIVKRPYRSLAMRTPTRALAESTAVTPTAQSPRSRPTPRFRPAPHISSPTERRPIAVDLQDDLTAKQSPRPSLLVNAAKDAEPSRANAQGAAKVVKQGRVKSAVQVFDSASAEDHPRAAANGRSETPNPPPTRASSSRTDSTRQTRVARASDKAARSRPDPPGLPSEPQAKPRSASHSAKVRAALRTLPPAPSHEPRQTTTGPSLQRKRGSANTRPGSPSPSAAAKLAPRGQKRTRPDDDDEDYAESVTRPAPATSTKRATRMPRTKKTSDAGVTGARPKRPRAAATKSEDDAPRAKRTRTSTK